jgi:hypothetical protein
MTLGSTQPLTEMSTRNLPGGKGRPARKANNLTPSLSRLYRKCGSLDVSQPYGRLRTLTEIPLPFYVFMYLLFIAYLTAVASTQYIMLNGRMMANTELEGMWKETTMLICIEALKETTKIVSEETRCLGRD